MTKRVSMSEKEREKVRMRVNVFKTLSDFSYEHSLSEQMALTENQSQLNRLGTTYEMQIEGTEFEKPSYFQYITIYLYKSILSYKNALICIFFAIFNIIQWKFWKSILLIIKFIVFFYMYLR